MKHSYLPNTKTRSSRKSAIFALLLACGFFNVKAQYCTPGYSSGTGSGDYISRIEIVGTTLDNISGASGNPFFTLFPATGSSTGSLDMAASYQVNVAGGTYDTCRIAAWGDWNRNGVFESSEYLGVSSNAGGLATVNFGNIIIPATTGPGTVRLRFRSSDTYPGPSASESCGATNSGFGETEDYEITVMPFPPCSGAPTAGIASASSTLICANQPVTFDLLAGTTGVNLDYQWQSSADNVSWTNIGTAQQNYHYTSTTISAATYFRCMVTCTTTSSSDFSQSVFVDVNPPINCYCTISVANNNNFNCSADKIVDFSISNVIAQLTNCDAAGYSDSTTSNYTSVNLTAGNTYTLLVNTSLSGSNGDAIVGAWIDYDQNSVFDANEYVTVGVGPSGTYSTTVTLPITVSNGAVRMRIMMDAFYADNTTILGPCTNNANALGQVLDYKVNLTAAPACTGLPNAGTAISTATTVCPVDTYTLDLTGNDLVGNISYQWQSSPNGTAWTNLGSAQSTIPYAVVTQSATTYYRCVTTCLNSSQSGTSTAVTVNQNLPTACYCTPENINCGSSQITAVVFETINDTPICNPNGYNDNTVAVATVSLTANQSYTISTDVNAQSGTAYVAYWIDYDQNGSFDANEYTDLGNAPFGTITGSVNVPFSAIGGITRMRIKMESSYNPFTGLEPCNAIEYNGQTLDYLVNITPVTPCAGTPNAGDATSTSTIVCQNSPFTLNLTGNDIASNMTYQWQSSPDNVTWTNMASLQTFVPYTVATQSVALYYRCITTCTVSALSATSTPVIISQNAFSNCYCTPGLVDCSGGDEINNVVFATISNTSTCNGNLSGYDDYTASVASATINALQTYTMDVTLGADNSENVSVWIDYDHSGSFDASEYTFLGSSSGSGNYTVTSTINIPGSALLGTTRMRVRNFYNNALGPYDACAVPVGGGSRMSNVANRTLGTVYGETEDYLVTILPPDCSSINFPPNLMVTGASNICSAQTLTLDINVQPPSATGITYQWNSSTGSGFSNDGPPSSSSSFTTAPSVTTYYYCEVLCNGSVVRTTNTATIAVGTISRTPTISNVTCNGLCDGAFIINATSGLPLTYSWTPTVATGDAATGLCPGSYSVTISNSMGCVVTVAGSITEPNLLTVTSAKNDISCFGLSDGSISLAVNGGFGSYSYSWTPGGSSTNNLNSLAAGSYTCIVTDQNSCSASHVATITEPTALTATSSQTNVTCFGGTDGSASVSPSGGTVATDYTYFWSAGFGSLPGNTITGNVTAQSYTCTITDDNGCTLNEVITLTEATKIALNISGATSLCEFSSATYSVSAFNAVGATTYTWSASSSAQASNNATFTYTAPAAGSATVFVEVTDANGCSQLSAGYAVNIASSTNISGTVSQSITAAPVAGNVVLYKYEPFFTKFDSVGYRVLDASGNYSFNNTNSGTYIVKAIPTSNLLQVTYGSAEVNWKTATQISHGCVGNAIQNITAVPLATVAAGGLGSLSGTIYEGQGYGHRASQTAVPGNPIGGIIVKGGKNPGGTMFVQTTTNGQGQYTLSALPDNNPGENYFILVDIPGLDTNHTYHKIIISNDNYTNLDFFVDSTKINPVSNVSVHNLSAIENQIKVFPNPASNKVTIQYSLVVNSSVTIDLYDIFGKLIRTIQPQTEQSMDKHSYAVPLDDLASGMYFVKLKINNAESVIKLFVTD